MTSPVRAAEADQASTAFHLALTQLGVATIGDALTLWAGVPPTRTAALSAAWLRRAIHLVMTRRARGRDLAMAYYRLVRALRTGTTVADPRRPDPPYVTLGMLRNEFAALTGPAPAAPAPAADDAAPRTAADVPALDGGRAGDDDDDRILVEQLDALDRDLERLEQAAEKEARIALEELGPRNLDRKLADIDTSQPAELVDDLRDDAHRRAGTRQAATAERLVMNGARSTMWSAAERDRRAIGYIRLSRTGTPCGWCAMLISRGPVYRSQRSAEYADGDRYHDNCHCYAEPVFDRGQYASSRLYALNREYQELWPKVTKGLSGKAALRAWRRFIRQQQADAREALPARTAQEAQAP
ncbi:hypothetical protein ACTOB_007907 [Actinoplanes oblitus]|uniref:Capsid maturation protease n=1 Tax=Actinoplanes oblitus TaxID=3040509 RepID=A0ABY8WEF0_9ACTN|nr:hypothetical protein [Actinoplanes oblitus]WIM95777.1 hypothetical protein ACTOB_007907 [Actinoplanes oblitus]